MFSLKLLATKKFLENPESHVMTWEADLKQFIKHEILPSLGWNNKKWKIEGIGKGGVFREHCFGEDVYSNWAVHEKMYYELRTLTQEWLLFQSKSYKPGQKAYTKWRNQKRKIEIQKIKEEKRTKRRKISSK